MVVTTLNCKFVFIVVTILASLVPRPSLSLSSAITILEAGKKELAQKACDAHVISFTRPSSCLTNSFFPASKIVIAEESEREGLGTG